MAKKTTKDFNFTKFIFDILVDVIIVFLLVVMIRNFVFAPFRVHGQSMCDTFNDYDGECLTGDGEFVLTNRFSTYEVFGWQPGDIDRGNVVIFQAPYSDDDEYFVLGDNRKKSSDSRRCFKQLGCDNDSSPFLNHDLLEGEVEFVIYPFSHMRFVDDPDYSV